MPSLISQIRNGTTIPQPQPQLQLNNSIANVKQLMAQIQGAQNPYQALLQNSPQAAQIVQLLSSKNVNMESFARQLATQQGVDINELLRQLGD